MEVIGSKSESTVVLFDEKNKNYVIVDTTTDQEVTINEEFLISLGKTAQRKKTGRFIDVKPHTGSTATAISSSSYSTSSVLPSSLEQAVDDLLKDVSFFNDDGSVKETFIEVDKFNKEFKTDFTAGYDLSKVLETRRKNNEWIDYCN